MNRFLGLIAGILMLSWQAPAQALTIAPGNNAVSISPGDVGQSFAVDWAIPVSGHPNLSASSVWNVTGVTPSSLTLKISISNTTPVSFASSVHSFGAAVTPDATSAFAAGGQGSVFQGVSPGAGPQQTFPGGFKGIDFCAFSTNNCAGGSAPDGLLNSVTDTITVVLSGVFGTNSISLALFPIKFQTGVGSFEVAGVVSPVPLPSALLLFGSAMAGAAGFSRRRQPKLAIA